MGRPEVEQKNFEPFLRIFRRPLRKCARSLSWQAR